MRCSTSMCPHTFAHVVCHTHLSISNLCLQSYIQPMRLGCVLAPHFQVTDFLPLGCLIITGDQAYHRNVIRKLDDGVGVMRGHAVVGEQGVQEWTKHTPLWGPCVEGCLPSPPVVSLSGSPGPSCRRRHFVLGSPAC